MSNDIAEMQNHSTCRTNDCGQSSQFEFFIDLLTLGFAPLTVIFNSLVLFIAFRYINLQQRLSQRFVVSMTLSDLLYGIVYMCTRLYNQLIPRWLCGPYYMALWACQIGSVAFLLLLNIDKFISIRYPLKYPCIATNKSVNLQVFITWLIIISFSVITFHCGAVQYEEHAVYECIVHMTAMYYTFMLLICYVAPLVSSLMISIYIAWEVLGRRRFPDELMATNRQGTNMRGRVVKKIFFVFISTLWSSITFLPYRIGLTWFYLCRWRYSSIENSSDPQLNEVDYPPSWDNNFEITSAGDEFTWKSNRLHDYDINSTNWLNDYTLSSFQEWEHEAICRTPSLEMAISVFLCLLPLGAVGNPLVTICTQNSYRKGLMALWSSLRLGKCFARYVPIDSATTKIKTKKHWSVDSRTGKRTSGTSLPILYCENQRTSGNASQDYEMY